MNLTSDAGVDSFALDCSFVAGAVGFSDWATAPEMITPLAAVVIRSFLSIFDLLHMMRIFRQPEAIVATAAMPLRNAANSRNGYEFRCEFPPLSSTTPGFLGAP